MKRFIFILLAACLCVPPAFADDAKESQGEDTEKKQEAEPKKGETTTKAANPIKKLIEIKLDPFVVPARMVNLPLPGRVRTIRDLLERFDNWSKDEEIGAVMLNLDGLYLSLPDVEELRAGLGLLRQADKRIYAFLSAGDPMGYLLACEADEIAIAPSGAMTIPGIGRLFPFMRGHYQMRGLEYDVITAGRYKYPGFLNRREPDKFFTEEFSEILDSWFDDYVNIIAEGRDLEPEKVRELIDIAFFDAQDAKNRRLVDAIAYYDDYRARVLRRTKFRKARDDERDFSRITSLNDLINTITKQIEEAQKRYKAVGPKIAVLHARGPIVDVDLGSSWSSMLIMRDQMVKTIEEIKNNKSIRAVVLRIDSPGGSGYASDIIWQKLRELDEEKPVVVSMGSVAGSGGYYIACPGRLIYAEPTTLTGSIGVLAILANQSSALNRLDVNLSEMKRGARSLFGAGHRDTPPEDREFIQKLILDFYEIFLDRVAVTRRMPKDEVRKLAEGRVYTGRQALKIGLVDRLGDLNDAITAVREMVDIPPSAEVRIVHYPRPSSLGEFAESLVGLSAAMQVWADTQRPAGWIPFDNQVRHFASQPRPLAWMAMPEVDVLLSPSSPWGGVAEQETLDLLRLVIPAQPQLVLP